jgi:tRNA G10  N-methylase Trm11
MRAQSRRRRYSDTAQAAFWREAPASPLPPRPVLPQLRSLDELRNPRAVLSRLKETDWSFTDDDTGYLGHDLHPYPAKFIPQIPSNLIASLSLPGELVWDPFGGSGTTALEALLLGRRCVSTDVNPLATLIAETKTTALSPEQLEEIRSLNARLGVLSETRELDRLLDTAWPAVKRHVPEAPNIETWFSPVVTRELAYIKEELETISDPAARRFGHTVLSSIIVTVSNQDGETRYARREKGLPPGATLRLFCAATSSALTQHEPMERLLGYRRADAFTLDARHSMQDGRLLEESVDLIVTSPPYANANDYHLYHRFRLFWLGHDPRQMASTEIGSHLRHQREESGFELYEDDLRSVLDGMLSRLRPGRCAALVVGDSLFKGITVRTADAVAQLAVKQGFEVIGAISRLLHRTRRSFIPTARRARSEDILLLRKKSRRLTLRLIPPSYRMWPYEEVLRRLEIKQLLGAEPKRARGELTIGVDAYQLDRTARLAFTHGVAETSGAYRSRSWQAILENGETGSKRKDPKYLTHGLHPYKGKFYPQLAKALLNVAGLKPGARVLDPFCGSGTVLLEAQLNGFEGVGCDLNPLAISIARAKTAVATESCVLVDRILKDFADRIREDRSRESDLAHFRPDIAEEVERWFPYPVMIRLGWILSTISHVPSTTARLVLQVLLSSIIREVSQQEPADLRIRRRKKPLKDAPVLQLFSTKIAAFRRRLRHFGERMSAAPAPFAEVTVIEGDARDPLLLRAYEKSIDCVVTSPPYATALPYIDTDRLSILTILQIEASRRASIEMDLTGSREIRERQRRVLEDEIERKGLEAALGSSSAASTIARVHRLNQSMDVGFRRRNMAALLLRYFKDMNKVLGNLSRQISPGGMLFFVIGDNKTTAGEEPVEIRSGKVLAEMGGNLGWKLEATLPISVTRDAPLHSHNSITENTILCFRA